MESILQVIFRFSIQLYECTVICPRMTDLFLTGVTGCWFFFDFSAAAGLHATLSASATDPPILWISLGRLIFCLEAIYHLLVRQRCLFLKSFFSERLTWGFGGSRIVCFFLGHIIVLTLFLKRPPQQIASSSTTMYFCRWFSVSSLREKKDKQQHS